MRVLMMLLQGGAGTGKTTLIAELFQGIQSQPIPPMTCAIAPTNQAKDVLKGMLASKGIVADVMTAAQVLGMRMDDSGEFNRDYSYEHPIDKYDLILADECSSYGSKYWQHFQSETLKGRRFLFMGDEAQLWEVNGGEPPAFTDIPTEWQFNLSEVKRYDGAILSAALAFRSAITQRQLPAVAPSKDEGLYVMSDKKAWLQTVVKSMKKSQEPGDYVAIVYRNSRVSEINQASHEFIHGSNADRFYEGQSLIADAPHMDSGVTTSQRITIERLQKGSVNGYDCHFISFWGEYGLTTAPVLTRDAEIDFDRQCKAFKQSGQGWRAMKLRSQFLWVSYSHSITAHKAQGSTLGTIFLDLKDIALCSTKRKRRRDGALIYEAPQLAYVGLTRASKKAVVLQ
jgi:ATP-dependent exoDNAse (exonuclease V) alpha subunit